MEADDFGVLLQATKNSEARRAQARRENMGWNVWSDIIGVKDRLRRGLPRSGAMRVALSDTCAILPVLRNGGALVSTVGWSLVLHAGEVCWSPYQPRQNTNANYDEELALAA